MEGKGKGEALAFFVRFTNRPLFLHGRTAVASCQENCGDCCQTRLESADAVLHASRVRALQSYTNHIRVYVWWNRYCMYIEATEREKKIMLEALLVSERERKKGYSISFDIG